MEFRFKKALPLAGLLCGIFSTAFSASADQYNNMNRNSNMNRPAGQIQDDGQGMMREITPSAGPRVSNGADVFITADFILWSPRVDGMAYAWTGLGNDVNSVARGSVKYPNWRWEPGFKVGLGLNLDHDGWDLYAEYTWLQSNRGDAVDYNETLAPLWDINAQLYPYVSNTGNTDNSIRTASSQWKLSYNVIDLSLGRNYFISQYLTLRPFVGFRGAWISQKWRVQYTLPDSALAVDAVTARMDNNQDYWGFGMLTGMNTGWHFTKEFSLYGNFDLALLWSDFTTTRRDVDSSNIAPSANPQVNVNTVDTFHTIKTVMGLEMGLRYETWFSDDDYHFLIQAGWSEILWSNFNQLFTLSETGNHGDFTLQGLTVKARFDF